MVDEGGFRDHVSDHLSCDSPQPISAMSPAFNYTKPTSVEPTGLLKEFSVLHTDDPAVARDVMRARFGHDLITPETVGFFVRSSLAELPNVSIFYSACSQPVSLPIPKSETAHVHLILRGRCTLTTGRHRVDIGEGGAFVCSPGRAAQLDFGPDHQDLALLVPPATLERTLAVVTGFPSRLPITFEPALDTDDPQFAGFRGLLMLLAGGLDRAFSVWPKATLIQLEHALVTSLLFCSKHNQSRRLPNDEVVPALIRQAELYADSRSEADLTIEDVAQATGVSVSTLTRAFVKHRGYSPATLIKRARLSRAKALLESGAATTVIGVALRCGFANPSRFANDYRASFGESPTQTLRRCRPG